MRFLRLWFKLVRAFPLRFAHLEKGYKIAARVVLALGLVGTLTVVANWFKEEVMFPVWAMVLVAAVLLLVAYLALTAGMAWEQFKRLRVKIGPLQIYPSGDTFFLSVENESESPVSVVASVTFIADEGEDQGIESASRPAYWIEPTEETRILGPHEKAHLGLSVVGPDQVNFSKALYWYSKAVTCSQQAWIYRHPFSERTGVQLKVVIHCATADGEGANVYRLTCRIAYSPQEKEYSVGVTPQ